MTTNKPSTFRYYPIKKSDLGLLRAYKKELEDFREARQKLAAEFEERVQQLASYHTSNFRSMWWRLATEVGLDPEETWGSPEYQVEIKYLDEGFGALLYIPQVSDPFGVGGTPRIAAGEPEEFSSDIPDDKTTRH